MSNMGMLSIAFHVVILVTCLATNHVVCCSDHDMQCVCQSKFFKHACLGSKQHSYSCQKMHWVMLGTG